MADMQHSTVRVLEQTQVSPPPGTVPSTSLPLTFFDAPWLLCRPMQRLYFYEFPHPTHHFLHTILPSLKHSLSLTLRHFFPLSANLLCPPFPAKPHFFYTNGDSIRLTVVESPADFNHLMADYPRNVQELHPFVPNLPPARVVDGDTRVVPVMALQSVTFSHVAADGRAFHHFMKSWASVCKTGAHDLTSIEKSIPFHDRAVVKDPNGLELIFLKEWWNWASTWKEGDSVISDQLADKVRATFDLGHSQIERLKHWVQNQCSDTTNLYTSTFVVTCALIWVCLVKSQQAFGETNNVPDRNYEKPCYLIFVADCRNRFELSIPFTYFGNCLALCFVSVKKSELLGVNGMVEAVKAIGNKVGELESGGLKGAEKWMLDWKTVAELGDYITVAGSQRLGIYETDFGWGRPKKTELVQIDVSGAISLAENREDKDGVEVGLALSRPNMDHFNSILEKSLRLFH
ncbi:coumaroyl-CoA:anthocyanidin 3-O-glucoside-6''-O-coumaroyltransferase 1 [Ziziphus jujuba]|uniref:Coumaroyl-CoA:anthocyanidin 3-O-glucoside-6''-O-coumaroyltransferase 1 n=1 Tax=Ziziphus jujuba TaxID=326968 RepID=A0ABM4A7V2_ZIZJJ|nr:coumaroyl-CoA:anthocyanidin 3-O-glucoside-6''-O-coumaroyltransferase 1 [Ziziphus jujuba]